LAFLIQAGG